MKATSAYGHFKGCLRPIGFGRAAYGQPSLRQPRDPHVFDPPSRLLGTVQIFSHSLRSWLMDWPGRVLEENRKRFFASPSFPRQAWIPASIWCAPIWIQDIFRITASAAPQSFFSQSVRQWNQSRWKDRCPGQFRSDRSLRQCGQHRAADPYCGPGCRSCWGLGDCLIVPGKGLLDLSGFDVDAGADIMRLSVIRSEQDGLVGVFGGALQRLFAVMFPLVPSEYRIKAIGPGQPDIARTGRSDSLRTP